MNATDLTDALAMVDQLRAELEAEKKRRREAVSYSSDVLGENTKLRADNKALRARLGKAADYIRAMSGAMGHQEACDCKRCEFARSLASGSSTGEAPKCLRCGGTPATCIGADQGQTQETPACDGCCQHNQLYGHCRPIDPAAPEPAPAPVPEHDSMCACAHRSSRHAQCHSGQVCRDCRCISFRYVSEPMAPASAQELAPEVLAVLRDKKISLGDHDLCAPCLRGEHPYAHFPNTPCPALASAQGTTESVKIAELRGRLEAQRGKIEDLDKRVAELESWRAVEVNNRQSLETDVERLEEVVRKLDAELAELVPQHLGLEPYAPPQSAPVERHAFVPGPGLNVNLCWHPTGKPNDVCGQPRSAAVHGEGGK